MAVCSMKDKDIAVNDPSSILLGGFVGLSLVLSPGAQIASLGVPN
jgi:hypothetical protein